MDDEPVAVEILSHFFETKGHRVDGAASAEEAFEALRGGSYDLVLLDIVLPGCTGLQALAQMKNLTRAPIHIMSGMNDGETRKDALLLGAAGFFGKPLDLPAILAAIEALPPAAA